MEHGFITLISHGHAATDDRQTNRRCAKPYTEIHTIMNRNVLDRCQGL